MGDEQAGGLPEDGQILFAKVHLTIARLILDGLCVASLPPCAVFEPPSEWTLGL